MRELTDMSYLLHSYQGENAIGRQVGQWAVILLSLFIFIYPILSLHRLSFPLLFSSFVILSSLFILAARVVPSLSFSGYSYY